MRKITSKDKRETINDAMLCMTCREWCLLSKGMFAAGIVGRDLDYALDICRDCLGEELNRQYCYMTIKKY